MGPVGSLGAGGLDARHAEGQHLVTLGSLTSESLGLFLCLMGVGCRGRGPRASVCLQASESHAGPVPEGASWVGSSLPAVQYGGLPAQPASGDATWLDQHSGRFPSGVTGLSPNALSPVVPPLREEQPSPGLAPGAEPPSTGNGHPGQLHTALLVHLTWPAPGAPEAPGRGVCVHSTSCPSEQGPSASRPPAAAHGEVLGRDSQVPAGHGRLCRLYRVSCRSGALILGLLGSVSH